MADHGILHQALVLAGRGWRVFPCESKGKKPLLADWPHRATCDPAEVKSLFSRSPDPNIAVATGRDRGILYWM
jgi:hypothetical protein